MVYIYKKTIGEKEYYYLRASVREGDKILAKDIKYLGNSLEEVRESIKGIPSRYSKDIRKAYKTLNRFIEMNSCLEGVRSLKLKKDVFLKKESQEKLRWSLFSSRSRNLIIS